MILIYSSYLKNAEAIIKINQLQSIAKITNFAQQLRQTTFTAKGQILALGQYDIVFQTEVYAMLRCLRQKKQRASTETGGCSF